MLATGEPVIPLLGRSYFPMVCMETVGVMETVAGAVVPSRVTSRDYSTPLYQ